MRKLIAALLLFSAPVQAAQAENDWLLVPGERAGFIHSNTSLAQLRKLLGEEATPTQLEWYGDAYMETTHLYKGTDDEILIRWEDETHRNPYSVCVTSAGKWHTKEGIKPGMSLKALEAAVDHEIAFAGFAWDFGGTVDRDASHLPMGLVIRLSPSKNQQDVGGGDATLFHSKDPGIGRYEIVVHEVCVGFH